MEGISQRRVTRCRMTFAGLIGVYCAFLTARSVASKTPLAYPIAVWKDSALAPFAPGALVNVQELLPAVQAAGGLWLQDRYLTTATAADRYPHVFAKVSSADMAPQDVYLAKNLYASPDDLPKENVVYGPNLGQVTSIGAGQLVVYDLGGAADPEQVLSSLIHRLPAVVLSGSISKEDADRIVPFSSTAVVTERRLQEDSGDSSDTAPFQLNPQDMPAVFYIFFFIATASLGLLMLHRISGPVAFENKVLTINREY